MTAKKQDLHSAQSYGLMTDAELAIAAREDPQAFTVLYRRYLSKVYRYVYSHTGDKQGAEDITAQVFTAAWEGLSRYREQGTFAAWIFQIARHKTADYHRRRRGEVPLEKAAWLQSGDDPAWEAERGEDLRKLERMLAKLDPERLEMLRLRFAAGLSYAEMGGILGKSEGAVKIAVHRLVGRMQEEWKQDEA